MKQLKNLKMYGLLVSYENFSSYYVLEPKVKITDHTSIATGREYLWDGLWYAITPLYDITLHSKTMELEWGQ